MVKSTPSAAGDRKVLNFTATIMNWKPNTGNLILILVLCLVLVLPLGGSAPDFSTQTARIRAYTRPAEFDYVSWTLSALGSKLTGSLLGGGRYLPPEEGNRLVRDYLALRDESVRLERELTSILADPAYSPPSEQAQAVRRELGELREKRDALRPLVEGYVQRQLTLSLADLDLNRWGVPFPPVLYHAEPDAYALIVSPRDEIRQAANLMLLPDLTLDQRVILEDRIEAELDLSALVVGVGGVGLYPAMIIETGSLNWLYQVIGHEWTHNYLTLRPLGANYFRSPELQTINETVADLSSQEILRAVQGRYFPELLPEDRPEEEAVPEQEEQQSLRPIRDRQLEVMGEDRFDFRFEMHLTRVVVDRLLEEGRVKEAEDYLESRREFFWENGYPIRKLNQAYFAFYGSYAAQPGGAAGAEGADLGSQLRALQETLPGYRRFMREVAWKWKLEQFQDAFARYQLQ